MGKYKKIVAYNGYNVAEAAITAVDEIEVRFYNLGRRQNTIVIGANFKSEMNRLYLGRFLSAKLREDGSISIKSNNPEEGLEEVFNILELDGRYKRYIDEIEESFNSWYEQVREQNSGTGDGDL